MLHRVGDITSDQPNLLVDVPAPHLFKPILEYLLQTSHSEEAAPTPLRWNWWQCNQSSLKNKRHGKTQQEKEKEFQAPNLSLYAMAKQSHTHNCCNKDMHVFTLKVGVFTLKVERKHGYLEGTNNTWNLKLKLGMTL